MTAAVPWAQTCPLCLSLDCCASPPFQALRLPHFTPPRPLALITAPDGGPSFLERLFTRALSTTLLAAVTADRRVTH